MNIVGQDKLLSMINTYTTLEYLPKTLMLIGPTGCGRHTIAKYVAEKFNLDYLEISTEVSSQDLEDYMHSTINTLYVINVHNFSEKQQNQFLKFIEEPTKSVYIILIANSEAGVLNTVLNRCKKYHLEPYTMDQVEQIINNTVDPLAFKIFKTPGKLLNITGIMFKELLAAGDYVIHNITSLTYANTLLISAKINYKDLYSKLDFDLFLDTVEYLSLEEYKVTGEHNSLLIFKATNRIKQMTTQQNLNKETLMLSYLTELWEAIQS